MMKSPLAYNSPAPSLTEIESRIASGAKDLPALKMAILRNITIEPIEPYIKYHAFCSNWKAETLFGQYDNIVQEALETGGIIQPDTDIIWIFQRLEKCSPDLTHHFSSLSKNEIDLEIDRIIALSDTILKGIRCKTAAPILWQAFEPLLFPSAGILDSLSMNGQNTVISRLNTSLKTKLQSFPGCYYVDIPLCLARVGFNQFYDFRYWYLAKAPYTREALSEIANENFKLIRALKGKTKKCLVLDCDNTLWGGVLGEEGISRIKLSEEYPGAPYKNFQREILKLYERGILLCLCSKNNEADIWEVFDRHPDMVLKRNHIVCAEINWENKADNITRLSQRLNIGLDSMVFIDDSLFEIDWIRQALPMVTALHFPVEEAVHASVRLTSAGLFDITVLSEEDKQRSRMIKAEFERKSFQTHFQDIREYLKSLNMTLSIHEADLSTLARISQLTLRTNQFNLTTKRYQENELSNLIEKSGHRIFSASLKDKFGDMGMIGAAIINCTPTEMILDSFLVSCRALGRHIERLFLEILLSHFKGIGFKQAIGRYRPTLKNKQVELFYTDNGFEYRCKNGDENEYVLSLDSFQKKPDEEGLMAINRQWKGA